MPIKLKTCRICGQGYLIAYGGGVCGPNGCRREPKATWTVTGTDPLRAQLALIEEVLALEDPAEYHGFLVRKKAAIKKALE